MYERLVHVYALDFIGFFVIIYPYTGRIRFLNRQVYYIEMKRACNRYSLPKRSARQHTKFSFQSLGPKNEYENEKSIIMQSWLFTN